MPEPTDKELIIRMLTSVGLKVQEGMWTTLDRDDVTIGVEMKDGSVGFAFNPDGSFKDVWGRDW